MSGPLYPLSTHDTDVATAGGRLVAEVTLAAVTAGEVGPDDLRIAPGTLRTQATFAVDAGNPQLAANLRRGAELVAIGDDELLGFYELLRPRRATGAELDALADDLESRGAGDCAGLVREARAAYARRGLLRE